MKRVLVGADGSDAADAARGWGGRLAHAVGAEVVVASVFGPVQAEVSPEKYEELKDEAGRRLAVEWSGPLAGSGVPHRPLLLTGPPDALLEAAEQEDAYLVVVASWPRRLCPAAHRERRSPPGSPHHPASGHRSRPRRSRRVRPHRRRRRRVRWQHPSRALVRRGGARGRR